MRIFLDNKGLGFKTVPVPNPCNMYDLVEIMRKKVLDDTSGFGIYEVRDTSGFIFLFSIFLNFFLIFFF